MREDIVAGIKNALDRGVPLERAVQSFLNAGYNPIEVRQAAESLTEGATSITNQNFSQPKLPDINKSLKPVPNALSVPNSPIVNTLPKKLIDIRQMPSTRNNRKTMLIAVLVFVLLLLIGGLVYMILYGQDFINSILNGGA